MLFDGTTHVDLGSHEDSCFGNFRLCPNGWTMSLWVKINTTVGHQVIIDSGGTGGDLGIAIFLVDHQIAFVMIGQNGSCSLLDAVTEGLSLSLILGF